MGIGRAVMGVFNRRRRLWLALCWASLLGSGAGAGLVPSAGAAPAANPGGTMTAIGRAPAVIPFPGTPDASPRSQVIFSALSPSQIRSVVVVGSRSGRQGGRLVSLPDDGGTAFVPARPFISPESVRVTASIAGAHGDSRLLRFGFGVAAPVGSDGGWQSARALASPRAGRARRSTTTPSQRYRSAPQLHPPVVHLTSDPDRTSGDIFLTPSGGRQHGPMILNSQGQLVWFDRVVNRRVYNLELHTYKHAPMLTWWEGKISGGHGVDGQDIIMNRSYRTVAVLHAGYGYSSDLHEFRLTSHGTALIDAYVPVHANLSSVGGPANGTVYDCVVQELDVRTGRVLWEWHSLGHVPLSASYASPPRSAPYDYFHLNSIQQLPDGNLLVSARQTWAVYLIDRRTGRIIWTLGGKYSDFHAGPGAQFEWQHDATLHAHGLLTVFDDGIHVERESSAKELRINGANHTVSLVAAYDHSPPLLTGVEGSMQLLSNHDVFVSWGDTPNFSEYLPGGRQIFNGSFVSPVNTYRAYRFVWSGQPRSRPALALSRHGADGVTLFVSWNGATDVASWRVLGGPTAHSLTPAVHVSRRGFETAIAVHSRSRRFAVQALNGSGQVLGTSPIAGG